MPPRKRTAPSKPPEPPADDNPVIEAQDTAPDDPDTQAPAETDVSAEGEKTAPDDPEKKDPGPAPDSDGTDLDECFPNGWPDGATAVGCEHGSWKRS